MLKRVVRRIVGAATGVDFRGEFGALAQKLDSQAQVVQQLSNQTFAVEELAQKLRHVENYQPVYGLRDLVDTPARGSEDRCGVILDKLGDVSGMKILDIGSSLGYISFFLADRGAIVQGWEASPQNAEVARLIGRINGVPVDFLTRELNKEAANQLKPDCFDAVIVLSVFHHIIRFQGLEATQQMVRTLLEKIPVMIVELARKGEDPKLPWDKSQPEDELEIFAGLDVKITKIGSFGNHLSSKERPLYMVESKKVVTVNKKPYLYQTTTHAAYKNSPVRRIRSSHRQYYFSDQYIVKEYGLSEHDEKIFNIPEANTEIATLTALSKMKKSGQLKQDYPEVIDAEVTEKLSRIVIKRNRGELLSDAAKAKPDEVGTVVTAVLKDVLSQLAELRTLNLFHNDVRAWNIIYNADKKSALLIDYGNASVVTEHNDVQQLLWALAGYLTDSSEIGESRNSLPERTVFKQYKNAQAVYDLVEKGETNPIEILKKVKL